MKILLFTHQNDIDGMGCALLARLAYPTVEVVFCETFDITAKFLEYVKKDTLKNYDFIYITDLCLKTKELSWINERENIKNKIKIIDHHESELQEKKDAFSLVQITIKDELGSCCATSLFYEECQKNKKIKKSPAIDEFVELTRQYDTWEWITKYHNEKAHDLNTLFSILGIEQYLSTMLRKLKNLPFLLAKQNNLYLHFKRN